MSKTLNHRRSRLHGEQPREANQAVRPARLAEKGLPIRGFGRIRTNL